MGTSTCILSNHAYENKNVQLKLHIVGRTPREIYSETIMEYANVKNTYK